MDHSKNKPPPGAIHKLMKLLLVLLFVDVAVSILWATYIVRNMNESTKSNTFDVVVVLMGTFNKDNTDLGQETLRRLNFALSLRDSHRIANYLCVGGSRPKDNMFGAEMMKRYLEHRGIFREVVFADGRSFDSKGNWVDALKHIQEKEWKTVGVISSALHLYRVKKNIIKPSDKPKVIMVPFSYSKAVPEMGIIELWQSIHYEWIAYGLYCLPDIIYEVLISFLRPQN